jgi:hypothetical protein
MLDQPLSFKERIMLSNVGEAITAVGGLGTAAFGLVDATKPLSGINHLGFSGVRRVVAHLTPGNDAANALPHSKIFATLQANWMNGTDLASQKAIAKSLIKLYLNADNAAAVARAAGVDPDVLTSVAKKIASGAPQESAESDVFGRFDLIVTAILDEAYQRADQIYRNGTRLMAMIIAIVLGVAGAFCMDKSLTPPWQDIAAGFIVGLLATPLAPIAKDLSTALATATNALQAVKK